MLVGLMDGVSLDVCPVGSSVRDVGGVVMDGFRIAAAVVLAASMAWWSSSAGGGVAASVPSVGAGGWSWQDSDPRARVMAYSRAMRTVRSHWSSGAWSEQASAYEEVRTTYGDLVARQPDDLLLLAWAYGELGEREKGEAVLEAWCGHRSLMDPPRPCEGASTGRRTASC